MMDLKVQFEEIKSRLKSGGLSSSDKLFIESYYERVLSRVFTKTRCNQCYRDAFIEMYTHFQKYGIREMGQFIMRRGESFHVAGECYTRVNITDEIAAQLLKENPKRVSAFESLPENWEKRVNEILAKAENAESEKGQKLEQQQTHNDLTADIANRLLNKETKKSIKSYYLGKIIDGRQLTHRMIDQLIKEAESQSRE